MKHITDITELSDDIETAVVSTDTQTIEISPLQIRVRTNDVITTYHRAYYVINKNTIEERVDDRVVHTIC